MEENILIYNDNEINFNLKTNTFYTFIGNKNETIYNNLILKEDNNYITLDNTLITKENKNDYRKSISFVSYDYIDTFTSERVIDELSYPLENLGLKNKKMISLIEEISNKLKIEDILYENSYSISNSKKVLVLISSALITNPKILILNNIFSLLDKKDKEIIIKYLKEYVSLGSTIVNFTLDIEESIYSDILYITNKDKIVISGKTMSVLNEEIILKRLGYKLPFIIELNKYMKDYGLIKNYTLDYERLVDKIWK